jgi:flagellar basal-body rod modification protein FlgD
MTTSAINTTGSPNKSRGKNFDLKTEDFINLMVKQLQNQDPLQPASNQELLAQMSQIGQLQSQTQLQEALKGLVLQNNLGAAGNLIGKMVKGLDDHGEEMNGLVSSVRVEKNEVFLELDNGKTLSMGRVTSIAGAPANHA